MSSDPLPVDDAKAEDTIVSDEEWQQAEDALERFKDMVQRRPRAKARYDALLAEIEDRQSAPK